MLENRNVHSLSTSKTIVDPMLKCEKLMEYFIASLKDQSNLFLKDISSLKYLVYTYSHIPLTFKEEVASTLKTYYLRHFSEVDVFVELNGKAEIQDIIKVSSLGIRIVAMDKDKKQANFSKDIDLEKYITK